MSKLCKVTFRLAAASIITLVPATASLADPGLPNARAHAHFIELPNDDQVRIGPDLCSDPDLQEAFNQFHFNVHHSGTPSGHIDTLGPQEGAPGLHNDRGPEIVATIC